VLFYGLATYGNAGFMREQVCKYMCPYARFQSAMFDKDTLIITYDAEAWRAARLALEEGRPQGAGPGSCIDCGLCVQVCPTGIDIRKGLQYECIGCAACVDVCDDVMDKMNYPPGLVRYDTQNGLAQHLTRSSACAASSGRGCSSTPWCCC
jgi:cytochrome c oxidase accessory protein FixG